MKVKICGVCRPADAAAAAAAGADFIGIIFAPGGARTQTAAAAQKIYGSAGTSRRVGVFADQTIEEISSLATELGLHVIQLHGNESPDFTQRISQRTGCQVWKTVWLHASDDVTAAVARYGSCANGLLLDAQHGNARGGTGARFDWLLAHDARAQLPAEMMLIAAGGLTPENVADAVAIIRPHVVDVASGVEQSIGAKSHARIHAFVRNAKA